jgi:glutaredoxin 3
VPGRVILFSTDSCTFCIVAKSLLMKRGVRFEEVNLAAHPELQTELASVTGLTSFPQIIVDGETLGGLNELRAADKNGTLAAWSASPIPRPPGPPDPQPPGPAPPDPQPPTPTPTPGPLPPDPNPPSI